MSDTLARMTEKKKSYQNQTNKYRLHTQSTTRANNLTNKKET